MTRAVSYFIHQFLRFVVFSTYGPIVYYL